MISAYKQIVQRSCSKQPGAGGQPYFGEESNHMWWATITGLHCIHAFAVLDYDLLDKIYVFTNVQDVQDDA